MTKFQLKNNSTVDQTVVYQRLGREIFGPLLADFVWWLHDSAKRDGITQLMFLSRDGYMLHRAYKAIIPASEQISNQYMFASRRLFNLAALRTMDDDGLRFLLGDAVEMPVGRYLARSGLVPELYTQKLLDTGFVDGCETVVTINRRGLLRQLFIELSDDILDLAAIERKRLKNYANTLADWDKDNCAVVDVGWHGSLQSSLQSVMDLKSGSIAGYYLGLHFGASRQQPDIRRAYLDESRVTDCLAYHNSLRRCVEIFELFYAETLGSVVGIKQTKTGYEPVRELKLLEPIYRERLEIAQAAMMESFSEQVVAPQRAKVLKEIQRLLSRPTALEATCLGDIPHQEGFGGLGRLDRLASPRANINGYMIRPGALFWDLRKTFWRNGFLARLLH